MLERSQQQDNADELEWKDRIWDISGEFPFSAKCQCSFGQVESCSLISQMQIAAIATADQRCPGLSFAPHGILSERQAQEIINVCNLQSGQMVINLMLVPAALRANSVSTMQLQFDPITTIQGRWWRRAERQRSWERKGTGWTGTSLNRVDPPAVSTLCTGIAVGHIRVVSNTPVLPRALALQCQPTLLMCRANLA